MNTDSYSYYHVPEIRKDGTPVWVTLGKGSKQKRDFAGVIVGNFYKGVYLWYKVDATYTDLANQEHTTTVNARPDQLKDRYEEQEEQNT